MIELTEQQAQALEQPDAIPPRVVNPRTKETCVLLRVDEYERLRPACRTSSGSATARPFTSGACNGERIRGRRAAGTASRAGVGAGSSIWRSASVCNE